MQSLVSLGYVKKDATAMVSMATGERPHFNWTETTKTAYIFELVSCQNAVRTPSTPKDSSEDAIILVQWSEFDADLNPANFSHTMKVALTAFVSLIGMCVTAASAIDACGLKQYTEEFQVREVVGSLATGKWPYSITRGLTS